MDIPFEHIQKLLKSYARIDPSVLIPDGTASCDAGKGEMSAPLISRRKKEQILNDIRLKVLEKIREHASRKDE